MGNLFVRKKFIMLGVVATATLLTMAGVLYSYELSSADEDIGRDPCDLHSHDEYSMNCWVSNSYSAPYEFWMGNAATFGTPSTRVWAKNWGVEICRTRFGNIDWWEQKIVNDTTYVTVSGSGDLEIGCLPEASISSASFHDVKGADSHTGAMTFRHPFRIQEDED